MLKSRKKSRDTLSVKKERTYNTECKEKVQELAIKRCNPFFFFALMLTLPVNAKPTRGFGS